MSAAMNNRDAAAAIQQIRAGIEALQASDLRPTSVIDARIQIADLQRVGAMLDAAEVQSLAAIGESGVYGSFGHNTAKVMVRHEAKLSNAEALARDQVRKTLDGLPAIAAAYRAGDIGTCQIRRIARVWANPRVRDILIRSERHFLCRAQTLPYKQFHAYATAWERRADEDGTIDQTERDHINRTFDFIDNYDGTFTTTGGFGNAQGNRIRQALDHFVNLEYEQDLTDARINRIDDNAALVMPRSARQRRADALEAMARTALTTQPGGKEPRAIANTLIDIETLERAIARVQRESVAADDPNRDSYLCETLDGHQLHPTDIARDILSGITPIRRAVIDARSVVIDLGQQRFFTGNARLAVQLSANECYWPGCHVPVSDCQIDHLKPHHREGRTNPGNGAPGCGKHNRIKQTGQYDVWRDGNGQIRIHNQHGTRVE